MLVQMPLKLINQLARKRHRPLPRACLRRPQAQLVQFDHRRHNLDRRRLEVDLTAGERHQLASPEAREARHQHERSEPRPDILSDQVHLGHRCSRSLTALVLAVPKRATSCSWAAAGSEVNAVAPLVGRLGALTVEAVCHAGGSVSLKDR
jgi:hypothetical protein